MKNLILISNSAYANNNNLSDLDDVFLTYDNIYKTNIENDFDFLHIYEIIDDEAIKIDYVDLSSLQYMLTENRIRGNSYLGVGGRIDNRSAHITIMNLTDRHILSNMWAGLTLRDFILSL